MSGPTPYEEELGWIEDGGPPGRTTYEAEEDSRNGEELDLSVSDEPAGGSRTPDYGRLTAHHRKAWSKLGRYGPIARIVAGADFETLGDLSPDHAAERLEKASAVLEQLPADRQEDAYLFLRDQATKALRETWADWRNVAAFINTHLPEPLGDRSPYTRDGLRDADLLDLDPPAFLVDELIPEGEVGILTGESGTGKSWLMAGLGCAVAYGGSWLGMLVKQTGHVRLFLPEGRAGYPPRLAAELIRRGELESGSGRAELAETLAGRVSISGGDVRLGDPRLEDHLRADIEDHGTRLAIFDTLNRSLADSLSENDTDDTKAVTNMLHRVAAETGVTFLLVHHPPHGEKRERGSKVWRQATDFRFLIYGSDKDARQGKALTLWNVKQRNTRPADDIGYRLQEQPLTYDGDETTTIEVQVTVTGREIPVEDRIREAVAANPGTTKSGISSLVAGRKQTVDEATDRLLADGFLRNENEGQPGPWSLQLAGEWARAEDEFPSDMGRVGLNNLTEDGETGGEK